MRRIIAAVVLAATALVGLGGAPANATPTPADRPAATTQATPNIVGGRPVANPESYPWLGNFQLLYQSNPNFLDCTAFEDSPYNVITAAHCVTYDDGTPADPARFGMHVRIGSNDYTRGGVDTKVTKITVFPSAPNGGFGWLTPDAFYEIGDLAVLQTADQLPYEPLANGVHNLPVGASVRQIGWGRTDPSNRGDVPHIAHYVDTTIDPAGPCNTNSAFPMGVDEVCVHNADGFRGDCGGDSGGPLIHEVEGEWQGYGVVSRSPELLPGCGGEDDIYASTVYYLGWIKAVERGENPVSAERYLPRPVAHHGPGPQTLTPAVAQQRTAAIEQWKKNYALAG
ncbi:trypsin [Kutzneria buriramensis]|uniref:Trypsin n=1 Tax=Kutzneria buriramensis TaxID=1045776 RepID=A0A3E0GWP3_9PSEU|nr:trypsin [Kutzneria buriramensis]